MKKMMIALVAMLTIAATGKAMSYEQARNEALFLTDKMAYELNLTEEQYEAAYEINLDYLMGVTSYDDVYGVYWERRNLDLSYILLDWQLSAFRAATYFYRPLYWADGFWHFAIYGRYPHRDYFYYGRPAFYASYRGGHAWHVIGGRGWYHGRRDHYIHHHTPSHFGMRDGWNRGDYRHHHSGNRMSSTRTTVNHRERDRNMDRGNREYNRGNREYNRGNRDYNRGNHDMNRGNRDYNRGNRDMNRGNRDNNRPTPNTRPNTNNTPRSLGGYRSNGGMNRPNNGGMSRPNTPSHSGGSYSGGSGMRNGGGSFSGGHSGGGARSGGGGSHGGGGRSSGGGHSYGGRR